MGGIGCELELTDPGLLHRCRSFDAYDERSEEHAEKSDRTGDQLGLDEQPLSVVLIGQAGAGDEPSTFIGHRIQTKRAGTDLGCDDAASA